MDFTPQPVHPSSVRILFLVCPNDILNRTRSYALSVQYRTLVLVHGRSSFQRLLIFLGRPMFDLRSSSQGREGSPRSSCTEFFVGPVTPAVGPTNVGPTNTGRRRTDERPNSIWRSTQMIFQLCKLTNLYLIGNFINLMSFIVNKRYYAVLPMRWEGSKST